ncbi:MAG: prolipoprotein diacylglyceryl transferase [Sphaerobacter sp.]|nr:prolipoprotein diacylglyceryl transferase [Sphaerobacter sp.]
MFHFTIGMDPTIAQIGPFVLAWHGLLTAVAIFVAVAVIHREFGRRGLSLQRFDGLAFWTIVGGIFGARLLYVIDHAGYFIDHPREALAIQEGGLAIYGAVIGGFFSVLLLTRLYGYPFGRVVDAIAPGLLLAQAIGRIGCLINGDAWGAPTSGPFAVTYTHPDALLPGDLLGVPTHPYPIYDLLMNLAVLGVVLWLGQRRLPAGATFAAFAALYAVGRFCISYVRQENVWFWGLQEAQVVSIAVLGTALVALAILLRQRQPRSESLAAD